MQELWKATRTELRIYSIGAAIGGVGAGLLLPGQTVVGALLLIAGALAHGWGMNKIYGRNR